MSREVYVEDVKDGVVKFGQKGLLPVTYKRRVRQTFRAPNGDVFIEANIYTPSFFLFKLSAPHFERDAQGKPAPEKLNYDKVSVPVGSVDSVAFRQSLLAVIDKAVESLSEKSLFEKQEAKPDIAT